MNGVSPTATPLALVILDGWGIAPRCAGNPLCLDHLPTMKKLIASYPHTELCAFGTCVGLQKYQVGNSEAGHLNIGAGRVVESDEVVISKSIANGTFFDNPGLLQAIYHAKKHNSSLHLVGMLSNGNSAHAKAEHLYALLEMAKRHLVKKVFLHLFSDGRDSGMFESVEFYHNLLPHLTKGQQVATISGRFYAMDRIKRWDRTKKTFNAIVFGKGKKVKTPDEAFLRAYARGESDEFIHPTVIDTGQGVAQRIRGRDAVIFFNTRSDRARQLVAAFVRPGFAKGNGFDRHASFRSTQFVTLTSFGTDLDSVIAAYPPITVRDGLTAMLKDYRQLYISEREKFAHVTYFFNGGYADPIVGEERVYVPSPRVNYYESVPALSARKITEHVLADLKAGDHDIYVINYANPDIIAHTGNFAATKRACKIVDTQIGRLYKALHVRGGTLIITADHGNAEQLRTDDGERDTQHNPNPVPFIIAAHSMYTKRIPLRSGGKLADIAPTVLDLLGVRKPRAMTGKSLFFI